MKNRKPHVPKARNFHAVNAWNRKAGDMGDGRKERSKSMCRETDRHGLPELTETEDEMLEADWYDNYWE